MATRDENFRLTEKSVEFMGEVGRAIKLIMNRYKIEFSLEEMSYLINSEVNEILLLEALDKITTIQKNKLNEKKKGG